MDNLSNLSYTNKDFRSIYSELLDLVTKVTNKWDPSLSNESDPGVILLKLCAIVADKNNYNIDKNILETFPASVTQVGNARELYDFLGYQMKWYQSATTTVSFKHKNSSDSTGYRIKKFTKVSDSSNKVIFNTLTDGYVQKGIETEVAAIEGILKEFTLAGEKIIRLDNLDYNNRLYFQERQIAQNGIFICNDQDFESSNLWKAVDNLEATQLGARVYKFGVLPNSDTCYVQFPQDIANLIDGGLYIKYIVSSGVAGNVKSGYIDTIYQLAEDSSDAATNVVVTNISSALDGADPENLNDAYKGYKELIGTFNNLITIKDYESAIRRLAYDYVNNKVVSNCVVGDRTSDVNFINKVVTLTESGERDEYFQPTPATKMTAFDLTLYPLKPIGNVFNKDSYNKSFTPNPNVNSEIFGLLEDAGYKAINHDLYEEHTSESPFIYLNIAPLNCKVITYNKVTDTQFKTIRENIENAIYRHFNASELTFGEAIDYNKLHDVIIGSDSNIKSIILDDLDYTLNRMDYDGTLVEITNSDADADDFIKTVRTKCIVSGVTPYYKKKDRFNFDYNQTGTIYENISSITTDLEISADDLKKGYDILENQSVQILTNKYNDSLKYGTGVKFKWVGSDISANTPIKTGESNCLELHYVKDGIKYDITYKDGTIIEPNFNISVSAETAGKELYLTGGQTITVKELSSISIGSNAQTVYYYFISNRRDADGNYYFPTSTDRKYILENGEYFFYTMTKKDLAFLGAGTEITFPVSLISNDDKDSKSKVSVKSIATSEDIFNNGLNAFTSDSLYETTDEIQIVENDITILGEGVKISYKTKDKDGIESGVKITSTYSGISDLASLTYTENDTKTTINGGGITSPRVRAVLDLNCSKYKPQKLKKGEKITIKTGGTKDPEIYIQDSTKEYWFQTSAAIAASGGSNIPTTTIGLDGEIKPIDVYEYTKNKNDTLDISYGDIFGVVDNVVDNSIAIDAKIAEVTGISEDTLSLTLTYYGLTESGAEYKIFDLGDVDLTNYEKTEETGTCTITSDTVIYTVVNGVLTEIKSSNIGVGDKLVIDNSTDEGTTIVVYHENTERTYGKLTLIVPISAATQGNISNFIIPIIARDNSIAEISDIYGASYKGSDSIYASYIKIDKYIPSSASAIDDTEGTDGAGNTDGTGDTGSAGDTGKVIKIIINPGYKISIGRPIEIETTELSEGSSPLIAINDDIGTAAERKYNFLYEPSYEIIEEPTLSENFFNPEHPYNLYTLPKIDIERSKIELVKSSRA